MRPSNSSYYFADPSDDATEALADAMGALDWREDENPSDLGFDSTSAYYNSRLIAGTNDTPTVSSAGTAEDILGLSRDANGEEWLQEKREELLREPIDVSFAEGLDAFGIISCLEFLSTWLTKSDDELIASGLQADILEDNFEVLVDVWESYR